MHELEDLLNVGSTPLTSLESGSESLAEDSERQAWEKRTHLALGSGQSNYSRLQGQIRDRRCHCDC